MRQTERNASYVQALESALDSLSRRIWTAMPGIVASYDPTKGTCVIQPSIQGELRSPDGTHTFVNMPQLPDVPVVYIGGGDFVATFPIQEGDEALVIFADRCIDSWWQSGGIQVPFEPREHDLSDGFALIGPRSLARKLTNVSTSNAQLRSVDGTTYLELTPAGGVNVVAPAGINLTGPVTINGNLSVTGTVTGTGNVSITGKVTASGEGEFNNVHVSTHVHGNVTAGGSNTGGPIG
jgi:hypothetical protein